MQHIADQQGIQAFHTNFLTFFTDNRSLVGALMMQKQEFNSRHFWLAYVVLGLLIAGLLMPIRQCPHALWHPCAHSLLHSRHVCKPVQVECAVCTRCHARWSHRHAVFLSAFGRPIHTMRKPHNKIDPYFKILISTLSTRK